jgi:dATP pyrophosphohydrolase
VPLAALRDCELVNVYEIYPRWRARYAPGVTHNTEHVFALEVPAGTPVVLAPREHVALQWLPWREAADACFSPSERRGDPAPAAMAGRQIGADPVIDFRPAPVA